MSRPPRSPRSPRSPRPGLAAAEAHLRDHALAKPEATEHFPWGERAIKVKGKVFLFVRADATELSLSTKLPRSSPVALMLPFAQPTGYGLGKAGWVSARFASSDPPPLDMLCAWIDESYQAVAPARLAKLVLTAAPAPEAARKPKPRAARKPKPARKPATAAPSTNPATATRKPTSARKPKPAAAPEPRTARKPEPATAAPSARRQRAAQRRGLGLDRR